MGIITKMRRPGIYEIRCLSNNKSYVGSSKNLTTRRAEHFRLLRREQHHNVYLQRAWNKYGEDSFLFIVLENCSRRSLLRREQFYIDKMKAFGNGFNLRPKAASNAGWKPSAEQKRRNSETRKGHKHTKESCKRISDALKGREFSDEHCANLSKALIGKKMSAETKAKISEVQKGRISNRKGATLSEATRKKMSMAKKGKRLSVEHIEKLKGKKHSDSTKSKMTESQKARWKRVTKKQRAERRKKILSATTHEQRSAAVTRGWKTRRAKCAA